MEGKKGITMPATLIGWIFLGAVVLAIILGAIVLFSQSGGGLIEYIKDFISFGR